MKTLPLIYMASLFGLSLPAAAHDAQKVTIQNDTDSNMSLSDVLSHCSGTKVYPQDYFPKNIEAHTKQAVKEAVLKDGPHLCVATYNLEAYGSKMKLIVNYKPEKQPSCHVKYISFHATPVSCRIFKSNNNFTITFVYNNAVQDGHK